MCFGYSQFCVCVACCRVVTDNLGKCFILVFDSLLFHIFSICSKITKISIMLPDSSVSLNLYCKKCTTAIFLKTFTKMMFFLFVFFMRDIHFSMCYYDVQRFCFWDYIIYKPPTYFRLLHRQSLQIFFKVHLHSSVQVVIISWCDCGGFNVLTRNISLLSL